MPKDALLLTILQVLDCFDFACQWTLHSAIRRMSNAELMSFFGLVEQAVGGINMQFPGLPQHFNPTVEPLFLTQPVVFLFSFRKFENPNRSNLHAEGF